MTERKLSQDYLDKIAAKFGTEVKIIGRGRVLDVYNAIPAAEAEKEAQLWISQAVRIVEPSEDEILRSCRLALAFERMMLQEEASVMTVDCYGTMFGKLPAFPCIGFTRLNNMGLGGICESDLESAMTHIIYQGLSGKPGFISDPTVDTSSNTIILAHCLGTMKMDGPAGATAPYKIRTIMEREDGAVPQVKMRIGQKVTQGRLVQDNRMLYFVGDIVDAPDINRGCRTKISVKVKGDLDKLWKNWSHGLHRVTCYGDITKDLERFCKFKNIDMVHEA